MPKAGSDINYSNYYVCLATGEDKLLERLVKVRNNLKPENQFHIEVTGLHTGDLMIGRVHPMNNENQWVNKNFISQVIENFQPLVLVERKTIFDFASSFRSNHYHSQKSRMITFREQTGCQCSLVVEEFNPVKEIQGKVNTIPMATLEQCFTSIRVRDKFIVEHVDTVHDHARLIMRMLKTIEKYKLYETNWGNEAIIRDNLNKDFQESLKVRKKENMTPEVCYKIQISSIPGISLNMAEKIADEYPTMKLLMDEILANGKANLENINLGKMKFGKVKAQRLCDFILQSE